MSIERFATALIATFLMTLSYSATAQMRPECGADPSSPGACFFPAEVGPGQFFCDDGIIVVGPNPDAKRKIGRVNPNGTVAIHQTAGMLPAGACRTEDFPICGTPEAPGPAVFLGEASLQANGFINPETGQALCPFKVAVKGVFFRDVGLGPEEVEIDAVLQLVKDKSSETGCRVQQCRIFAN